MSAQPACSHLDLVRDVQPGSMEGCEDCLASGGRWVHLRMCMTCGHIGCCDSSPNRHASKHAASHDHPLVIGGIEHPHRLPYPGER